MGATDAAEGMEATASVEENTVSERTQKDEFVSIFQKNQNTI